MYQLFFLFMVASASRLYNINILLDITIDWVGGSNSVAHKSGICEDAYLDIDHLAKKYGYPLETHSAVTKDGYILKMHRIPHGRNRKRRRTTVTVFLMHGLWESSDSWLLLGPNYALPYMLADQGYDVWMGNARGNKHSLRHISLNAGIAKFWDFSWEEIGTYDLPAMIDYILNFKHEASLYYAGYSQGTTSYFVMNSMKPKYNKKIKLMFALAPVVFLGNSQHVLLKILSPAQSWLQPLLSNFNIYSPCLEFFNKIIPFLCSEWLSECEKIFLYDGHHVNTSLLPVIMGHEPAGASTLQLIHYGQLYNSGRFQRFDYGTAKNIKKYRSKTPPDYNLKAVTTPVVMFHGGNDLLSDRRDVERLKHHLPNLTASYYFKDFTHVDFIDSEEASSLIYSKIIKLIKKNK